jgi:hypothetical protein
MDLYGTPSQCKAEAKYKSLVVFSAGSGVITPFGVDTDNVSI